MVKERSANAIADGSGRGSAQPGTAGPSLPERLLQGPGLRTLKDLFTHQGSGCQPCRFGTRFAISGGRAHIDQAHVTDG